MTGYKLTDKNDQTWGGCQWGPGVTHETDGAGDLCGPGWLHYYSHPLLAVLHNPIHGHFDLATAHLWEAEAGGEIRDDSGLKLGCTKLTTLKRVEIPEIATTQRVAYGILCACEVYDDPGWQSWADRWLSGEDRSTDAEWAAWAAWEATRAAWEATRAAGEATRAAWAVAAGRELDLVKLAKKATEVK